MADLDGDYDLIWCAGAVYFIGVTEALTAWRGALASGGIVAFSAPCLFDGAGPEAVAYWGGDEVSVAAGVAAEIGAAGDEVLGTRRVSDAGWEAYHAPMRARIAALRGGADAALTAVLEEAEAEVRDWQAVRRQTGYLISVVRPLGAAF
jgi:hypothetical protein